jgi:hypothetical protein
MNLEGNRPSDDDIDMRGSLPKAFGESQEKVSTIEKSA